MAANPAEKPRIWTVFFCLFMAIVGQLGLGVFVAISWAVLNFSKLEEGLSQEAIEEFIMQDPLSFLLSLLGSQLMFLAVVGAAAYLSQEPYKGRLGLNWGKSSLLWLPLWCLATLGSGVVGEQLIDIEESSYGKQMIDLLGSQPIGFGLVVIVLGSVLPGLSEELLFRGYVQGRLLKRWPHWLAILVSSVFFACFHMDLQYLVLVFPIGLWLGFLAYRLGGILPAIICHFFNNLIALSLMVFGPRWNIGKGDSFFIALDSLLILCLFVAVGVLFVNPPAKGGNP